MGWGGGRGKLSRAGGGREVNPCTNCGGPITYTDNPAAKYCRERCRSEKLGRVAKFVPRICEREGCDVPVPEGSRANRKWCSDRCQGYVGGMKHAAKKRDERGDRPCEGPGCDGVVAFGNSRFCGDECAKRSTKHDARGVHRPRGASAVRAKAAYVERRRAEDLEGWNADKRVKAMNRRRGVKQATHPAFKEVCDAIVRATPKGDECDHGIPLRGNQMIDGVRVYTVCGLHVPWNLAHLPMRANRRKSGTFNSIAVE